MVDDNGWMPIESAPRDSSVVLLWDRAVGVLQGWLAKEGWVHVWDGEVIPDQHDLTHWRPLPAPPGGGDE